MPEWCNRAQLEKKKKKQTSLIGCQLVNLANSWVGFMRRLNGMLDTRVVSECSTCELSCRGWKYAPVFKQSLIWLPPLCSSSHDYKHIHFMFSVDFTLHPVFVNRSCCTGELSVLIMTQDSKGLSGYVHLDAFDSSPHRPKPREPPRANTVQDETEACGPRLSNSIISLLSRVKLNKACTRSWDLDHTHVFCLHHFSESDGSWTRKSTVSWKCWETRATSTTT